MKQQRTEELLTVQGGDFYLGSIAVIKGVIREFHNFDFNFDLWRWGQIPPL
jgi:hypothetical protein